MNKEAKQISLGKIVVIWGALSALLGLISIISLAYVGDQKTFVIMLNSINIGLFSLVFMLRGRIEKRLSELVNSAIETPLLEIRYRQEEKIGYSLLSLTLIFGLCIIYVALSNVELYTELIEEDGPIEYGSSVFWFMAAVAMLIQLAKRRSGGEINGGYRLFHLIALTLFFITCSGEEISWGQRIIGLETPEMLTGINVQNELTLHNLGSISIFSNAFFFIAVSFFLLIPFLSKRYDVIEKVLNFIRFPAPNRFAISVFLVTLFVWVFMGVRFGTLGFHPFSIYAENYDNQKDDEVFEFMAAFTFFTFSVLDSAKEVSASRCGDSSRPVVDRTPSLSV